jgi:hypothetical protein
MNCQLLSWFCPTLANGPDSGSMNAMRTVSPFCGGLRPARLRASAQAAPIGDRAIAYSDGEFHGCLLVSQQRAGYKFCAVQRSGLPLGQRISIADVTRARARLSSWATCSP